MLQQEADPFRKSSPEPGLREYRQQVPLPSGWQLDERASFPANPDPECFFPCTAQNRISGLMEEKVQGLPFAESGRNSDKVCP